MLIEVNNDKEFEDVLKGNVEKRIIDFYSPTCGPCRALRPIMEQIAEENEDIEIVKVNIFNYENAAMKYSITAIPTLIYYKSSVMIDKSVGFMSKEEILNRINK